MNLQHCARRVCEAGREELEAFREQLNEVGLRWSVPEITVLKKEPEAFTAEFKVEFLHDSDLVDIFEFFVCREGVLVVSEDEVRDWIRENVPDVLTKQNQRLST